MSKKTNLLIARIARKKGGADDTDNNFALNESSSDIDHSAKCGRMECFERDIENTHAEVERC
jgi:hypothetical protein